MLDPRLKMLTGFFKAVYFCARERADRRTHRHQLKVGMGKNALKDGRNGGRCWWKEHTESLRYSEIIRYMRAVLCKVRAAVFFPGRQRSSKTRLISRFHLLSSPLLTHLLFHLAALWITAHTGHAPLCIYSWPVSQRCRESYKKDPKMLVYWSGL